MRNNPQAPGITGDLARVTIQYTGLSGVFVNTLDYMANAIGVITSAMMSALATAFQTAVEPSLKACLSNQCTILQYNAADLNPGKATTGVQSSGVAGTVVAAMLPEEMGIVILKRSLLKGQHGRGRICLPCVPITFTTPATSPDKTNATAATALAPLLIALAGSLTATGTPFTPVVTTRPTVPGTVPLHAQQISSWSNDLVLGTARRRKIGRGR